MRARSISIVCAALVVLLLAFVYSRRGSESAPSPNEVEHPAAAESTPRSELSDSGRATERVTAAPAEAHVGEPAQPATAGHPLVLTGTVFDVAGDHTRVAAAHVHVTATLRDASAANALSRFGYAGDDGAKSFLLVVTDELGRFRIERTGKYPDEIELSTPPSRTHKAARATVRPVDGQALDVALERREFDDVLGVTVDVAGEPVAGVRLVFDFGGELRTTVSDDHGRFRVRMGHGFEGLDVQRAGYRWIRLPTFQPREDGTFDEARVVLAPIGALRVAVIDGNGRPLSGMFVAVNVSPLERFGSLSSGMQGAVARLERITDASGVVSIDDVWASQRLSIEVAPNRERGHASALRADRHTGGVLLLRGEMLGQPVVVPPGAQLDLQARIPSTLRVRGRVDDESGRPACGAWVSLVSADSDRVLSARNRSDDEGRFELSVVSPRSAERVRVVASDDQLMGMQAGSRIALRSVELLADEACEIVLVLAAPLAITGRVLDAEGNGVVASIDAYADDEPEPRTPRRQGRSGKDGVFELSRLGATRYDVVVRPKDSFADARVDDVEAGRTGLEIRVREEERARVEVEIVLAGGESGEVFLLRRRRDPRDAPLGDTPLLPATATYSAPMAWPLSSNGLERLESGLRSKTWHLDEGEYWLGARAHGANGESWSSVRTGLVRVAGGEHRLRFELRPAARVEGRVRARDALELAVAIAWRGDELLDAGPADSSSSSRISSNPVRELGADGYFAFDLVPIGEHELRVGTPDELRAGRARHREKIAVKRGMRELDVDVRD